MRVLRIYLLAGLIILLLVAIIAYELKPQANMQHDSNALDELPDAIITNMHTVSFNESGQPAYIITTPELKHYAKASKSYLSEPHITIFKPPEQPWQIRSDHAVTENGTEIITLWDNVVLHQQTGISNVESTITTSELTYYPEKKMATTQAHIIYQQPGVKVSATGMRAYIEDEIVELLSEARGQYEQNH